MEMQEQGKTALVSPIVALDTISALRLAAG